MKDFRDNIDNDEDLNSKGPKDSSKKTSSVSDKDTEPTAPTDPSSPGTNDWKEALKKKMNASTGNNSNKTHKPKSPTGGFAPFTISPFEDDNDENEEDILEELSIRNYNEEFKDDDNTMFRDEVIYQTISTLIGKNKPNALLVGSAGVGKTKIVESLAHKLANDNKFIPDGLKGYTIYEMTISNLVAGTGIVGTLETKLQKLIKFMSNKDNKAILFIDEIHMILEGKGSSYDKIAQILKPALARGEMKVIGATTLQEVQNFMNDPAFNRRFSRIIVDELSKPQTLEILKKIKPNLIDHYKKIKIPDEVLTDTVNLAEKYKTHTSHRPDNAITLLDRAMAEALINKLKIMKWSEEQGMTIDTTNMTVTLNKAQVEKTAVKMIKGNNIKTDLDIKHLNESLEYIKGQNKPIEEIIHLLKCHDTNLFPSEKPLSILFAGPSGVGKTEVTKVIAKEITDMKPIILNMTEYSFNGSESKIIGTSEGFVGYDSNRELPFDILETNPYQIILLDEFEKAAKSVQRIFMQALDEGFIKTSKGKIIDFSKAIIIATTNASYTNTNKLTGFIKTEQKDKSKLNELSNTFDTELLNRFTKVINFNKLTLEEYKEIILDTYEREVKRIKETDPTIDLNDTLSDQELDKLSQNYVEAFGARPVYNKVKNYILNIVTQ